MRRGVRIHSQRPGLSGCLSKLPAARCKLPDVRYKLPDASCSSFSLVPSSFGLRTIVRRQARAPKQGPHQWRVGRVRHSLCPVCGLIIGKHTSACSCISRHADMHTTVQEMRSIHIQCILLSNHLWLPTCACLAACFPLSLLNCLSICLDSMFLGACANRTRRVVSRA